MARKNSMHMPGQQTVPAPNSLPKHGPTQKLHHEATAADHGHLRQPMVNETPQDHYSMPSSNFDGDAC